MGKAKKIAKDALAIPVVRKTYELTNRGILNAVGSTRVGATVYSIPGLATFNREQYAVLAGRRAYYNNLSHQRSSHVELRRNIHRLEKGIIMEPRRPIFAKDYIEETIDFYAKVLEPGSQIDQKELAWAYNTLRDYFATVDKGNEAVDRARGAFESLPAPQIDLEGHFKPYAHRQVPKLPVDYDSFMQLAKRRRSVRWYQDKPVPRELIDRAILAGIESPTACNRLPYEFLIFDEPDKVRKVASVPFGSAGFSHQIPTIIVVKGRLDSYFSPRDRHAIYIDAALAAMGFLYALETMGLSSTVINWPDFEPLEMKMSKLLGLKPYERVLFLIAVGYPKEDSFVPSSPKKSLDVIRHYNVETN